MSMGPRNRSTAATPPVPTEELEAMLTRLLIIDELGYLPLEPNVAYLFSQLISRCYQRGSVLITSNRLGKEWGEVFGDQVVATAILDRLLHHSHVLTIRGDSYRLREKRRSGLVHPQAGGFSSPGGSDAAANTNDTTPTDETTIQGAP